VSPLQKKHGYFTIVSKLSFQIFPKSSRINNFMLSSQKRVPGSQTCERECPLYEFRSEPRCNVRQRCWLRPTTRCFVGNRSNTVCNVGWTSTSVCGVRFVIVIVLDALSREFREGLPMDLLYALVGLTESMMVQPRHDTDSSIVVKLFNGVQQHVQHK